MIKKICDRCGKEAAELCAVLVPIENLHNGSYRTESVDVCPDCRKVADRLFDNVSDFRVWLFEKHFFTEGAGNEITR